MNYTDDIIEAYCLNKLSREELYYFEEVLKNDKELQEEVRKTKLALAAIDLMIKSDIEELYFSSKKDDSSKKPNESGKIISIQRTNYKKYFALAASVLLIVSVFSWLMIDTSHKRMVNFATNNIDIINPSVRGTSDLSSAMEQGLNDYFNNQNYGSAIQNFSNANSLEAKFYLGMSFLKNGDYDKAEETLNGLLSSPYFPHHLTSSDDVKWYIILSKVGGKKYSSSREAVTEIEDYLKDPSARYHAEAIKLKKQLENPLYNLRSKY
jgi:hypothetical protein